jgi:multidrug efflux pump subunit AcrA (membrane-fusion protein)
MTTTARFNRRLAVALAIVAVSALAVSGCRGGGGAKDVEEGKIAPAHISPVLAVTAAKVAVAPMDAELRLLGVTVAAQSIVLRAPVAGRVIGMGLMTGDRVRRGQVVAHVLSHEVEAAEQGLAIARKLDRQDAAALAKRVKPYTGGPGIAVAAPQAGVVAAPPVSDGQQVNYLDPLVELIDPASVYIDAAVPFNQIHLIRPGMNATVLSELKPGVAMAARVAAMLPSSNPANATASVRLEFSGAERIVQAGAPVQVRIVTRAVPDALVVPVAALFEDTGGSYHVFVVGRDGRAHRVRVSLGIRTPERAQVTSGLGPGQMVITSGGYALSDGLRVTVAGPNQ